MGGAIIWILIVIYIVSRAKNAGKKNDTTSRPNVQNQKTQAVRSNQQMRPSQNNVSRQQSRSNRPTQQRPTKQSAPTQNSILEKAKQHAQAQFEDDTKAKRGASEDLTKVPIGDEIMKDKALARHIHSEHAEHSHDTELHNQAGVDDLDTYHLIDEVNDLIVKGYSGNLNFERDFLAEGIDMLNRISG